MSLDSSLVVMPVFDFASLRERIDFATGERLVLGRKVEGFVLGGWQLFINPGAQVQTCLPLADECGRSINHTQGSLGTFSPPGSTDRLILIGGVRDMPQEDGSRHKCFVVWGDSSGKPKSVLKKNFGISYHVGEKGRMVIAECGEAPCSMYVYDCVKRHERLVFSLRRCHNGADTKGWRSLVGKAKAGFKKHVID